MHVGDEPVVRSWVPLPAVSARGGAKRRDGCHADLSAALLAVACALTLFHAQAADTAEPARPKDAAEEVQEGNVENWIKYYQRERGQGTSPTPSPQPAQQPAPQGEPKPGPQR
jgi:hypothetical protein